MKSLLLVLTFALAACSGNQATGAPKFNFISDNHAFKVGQQTANEAIQTIGLYEEKPELTQYLKDLNYKLQNVGDVKFSIPTQLIVLDSEEVNAWATPGYMNVYRGILPYLNSEAELVGVMGHEQGHNQARHISSKLSKGMVANVLLTGAAIYLGTQSNDDWLNRTVMQVGAFGAGVALASYSRADEFEADGLGVKYMQRLGYDGREAVNTMRTIATTSRYAGLVNQAFTGQPLRDEGRYSLIASHPPTPQRIARLVSSTGGLPDGSVKLPPNVQPATPASDPQGRQRYLNVINGLAIGPSPSVAVFGRDYLAFKKQRALIYLPDGYLAQVGQKTIRLAHPLGDATADLWFVKQASGRNPCMELQQQFKFEVKELSLLETQAGSGCTGVAAAERGRVFRLAAVPFTARDRMAIMAFNLPNPAPSTIEGALMQALTRSRTLTEAEARNLEPLRLAIRTARSGDTVASVARLIPQGALRQEWFRALNGMDDTTALKAGSTFKTVVDPNPF